MKIYPGENIVTNVSDILADYIPLSSVLDENNTVFDVDVSLNDNFRLSCVNNIKPYPYQLFDSDDIYFFDANNRPIAGNEFLKREGNKFYFEPKKSLEFVPRKFSYSLLLLKDDIYKNSVEYNIKVGAYSLDLAEELIGISQSSVTPSNVKLNNRGTMPSSYINMSYDDADFIFIDKASFDSLGTNIIEEYLKSHTNIWVSCESWPGLIKDDENKKTAILVQENNIYPKFDIEETSYYIDTSIDLTDFPKTKYSYINLFEGKCPVLILKKEDDGFIIISGNEILDNSPANNKMIYEILVKIYLNSYFESKTRESIIADRNIDYYIKPNMRFNKFHPDINLPRLLYQDGYNKDINYDIIKAIINNDETDNTIKFLGIDRINNICFKSNIIVDPEKESNILSILTANDTIIYFKYEDNNIKIVEEQPLIYYKNSYLIINPFKSSSKKIFIDKITKLKISETEESILYYDYALNCLDVIERSKYKDDSTKINVAVINPINKNYDLSFKDIRVCGGGEASSELNYDMIDTGSIKGRPYRLGSTMIIKLPERYRKHKDNLMTEIKKHISSADYPILIFK